MPRSPHLPPEVTRFWTTDEIDLATRRLERRIHDIEALQADGVRHRDPHLRNVEHSIRDTIHEVFGIASQEFCRHEHFTINNSPPIMGTHVDDLGALDALRQAQFVDWIPGAITRIRGLIDSLEAKREELAEPAAAPRVAFEGHSFDGPPLMRRVFSETNPILVFNDLRDDTDRSEQRGMVHLYEGAVMAIWNPGEHRAGLVQMPKRAQQHLELLSFLAERLDDTRRT